MLQTIQAVLSHQWFLPERTVVLPWSWTGPMCHVWIWPGRGYPLANVDPLLPRLTGNPQSLSSMWLGCGCVGMCEVTPCINKAPMLSAVRKLDWYWQVLDTHSKYRESQAEWIETPDKCGFGFLSLCCMFRATRTFGVFCTQMSNNSKSREVLWKCHAVNN